MKEKVLIVVLLTLVALSIQESTYGCGLEWKVPSGRFDNVDSFGHISCWSQLGDIDYGGKIKLPIQINFNSGRSSDNRATYLGSGWIFPLLESSFVQENEDNFYMLQPDGLINLFKRDRSNANLLIGSSGWRGEIKGDTITTWASCGWKLVFLKGRVASMSTPENTSIEWVYNNGRVSEIRANGSRLLAVKYDSHNRISTLNTNENNAILFEWGKRPALRNSNGQTLLTDVIESISAASSLDGRRYDYVFGIDSGLRPNLKIELFGKGQNTPKQGKGVHLRWNSNTMLANSVDDWTYEIKPSTNPRNSAEILRINSGGSKEFWFNDGVSGREITQGVDGIKRIKYWFLSGLMSFQTKKIEEITNGQSRVVFQASYDDAGRILRTTDGENLVTYSYDKNGFTSTSKKNDQIFSIKQFDRGGRLIKEEVPNIQTSEYSYLKDGGKSQKMTSQEGTVFLVFDSSENLLYYSSKH